MPAPRRVLFLQHASARGGSALSLLYTAQGLDRTRYVPVIALAKPAASMRSLYADAGLETLDWPGIETFEHTVAASTRLEDPYSWRHLWRTTSGFKRTLERTRALVDHVAPHVVHLNSAVLLPSAIALRSRSIPLVWHVREPPADGYFGGRKALLRHALCTLPDECVFLTEHERRRWVGDRAGVVVHNFVDLARFDPALDARAARDALGIPGNARVVLFVGGTAPVKGADTFIEALALLRRTHPDVVALLPNTRPGAPSGLVAQTARRLLPLLGTGTAFQRFEQRIERLGLENAVIRLDFRLDIERLLAASDVLVFPAARDHFARPVVEANAMGKPVVVSRLPVLEEMVEDGVNGLHARAGDPHSFADCLRRLFDDPEFAGRMGVAGRERALSRYDQAQGVERIMALYDRLIARRGNAS